MREFQFTVEIPASLIKGDLPENLSEQKTVLQGAVDCVFEENDQVVIVDYKTDRSASPEELWERYLPQLHLYMLAMEQVTGKMVKECLLYSFYLNREIKGDFS